MKKLLSWRIASRYLKSKKSHGAVSAIAIVSVAGVAIATAAVVVVLSVFNGFRDVLTEKYNILAPDITVSPVKGKVFEGSDSIASALAKVDGVAQAMPMMTDKALALYGGHEFPVTLMGVPTSDYARVTAVESVILPGGKLPADHYQEMPEFEYIEDYEAYMASTPMPEALLSIGAAVRLGNVQTGENFLLFAPKREGRYNPANPTSSFVADSVKVSGVYEAKQKDYDEDRIVVPIGMARHLFQYEGDEASSVDLRLKPGADMAQAKAAVEKAAGPEFVVKDRAEMQQINFRMINIEKWMSFLLLFFILIIATFNIVSTMTMLVLEKRRSMGILSALGMNRGGIAGIFRNESILVSILGAAIGVAIGVILCLLQEHYGLIRLQGNPETLILKYYPVKLIWTDLLLAFSPSVILGILTAIITGAFAKSRID